MANPNYIPREELKALSVLSPHKTALGIAFNWAVIIVAISVSVWSQSWLVYIASIAIIAGRQHALAVMNHDFAHHRFLKNKVLSEWIGDIFLAWPILITVNSYRTTHMEHHFHTNTDKDPDFVPRQTMKTYKFPMNVWFLITSLLGYAAAITSVYDIKSLHLKKISDTTTRSYVFARLGFYAVVGLIIGFTGTWQGFLLYWVVPYFTFFFAFNYVRGVAEHFSGMDYSTLEGGTRTVLPYWWERAFFGPHNVNYHSEHHLYPGVPFYNLPALHKRLMENPDYRNAAHITRGYSTGLVSEVLQDRYIRPSQVIAPAE
ncbi:MAG: fatty acid desaturase family protein [Rhizobiaceae bacterium]|nr:fatty acid desaturase family protein [Rhizobiaceae bacterium]